jgi:hypothetical protein
MAGNNGRNRVLGGGSCEDSHIILVDKLDGPAVDSTAGSSVPDGSGIPGVGGAGGERPLPRDDESDRAAAAIAERILTTAVRDWGCPEDPLWATHPLLARLLFVSSWNGYVPREHGRISVSVTATGVQGTLTLPSEAQVRTERATTILQLLDVFEDGIQNRPREWRELKVGPGAQKLREERKKLVETRKGKV